MYDHLDLLDGEPGLHALLEAYRAEADRELDAWRDRVMALAGHDADRLTQLHGISLANGWLEMRVGWDLMCRSGVPRQSYRLSRDGYRLLAFADDPFAEPADLAA